MLTDWLLDGVFGWLAARLADVLGWLLSTLTATFFTSPDVTVLPQVRGLADRSAGVVEVMFVLAILTAGVLSMTHGSVQVQYQAKDLLPRLVAGLTLSGFALPLCRGLIELANALTTALIGQAAAGPRVVEFVRVQLKAVNSDPAAQAMAAVITLLIVVLIFQLLLSLLVRIATLLVVAGLGPVALACYALPQTQPVAVLWWRCLLGALVTPALQGVAFSVGVDLLLDPGQNLAPMTGISGVGGSSGTTVMNLFFVACLLMLAVRIWPTSEHPLIPLPVAAVGVSHRNSLVHEGGSDGVGVNLVPLSDSGEGLPVPIEAYGVAGLGRGEAALSPGDGVAVEVGGDGGPVYAVAGGEFVDAGPGSVGVGKPRDGGRRQRLQLRNQA